MKRLHTIPIVLLLVLMLPVLAHAESRSYSIPEFGIEISFPAEYVVITRDGPVDAMLTNQSIQEYLKANGYYLWASKINGGDGAIQLRIAISGDKEDENQITSDGFSGNANEEMQRVSRMSLIAALSGGELFRTNNWNFLKLSQNIESTGSEMLLYTTIKDGITYEFSVYNYTGAVTAEQVSAIESALGTFTQTPSEAKAIHYAKETVHIPEMSLSVDLPANYFIVTRQVPANTALYDHLKVTPEEFLQYMEERDVYLESYDPTGQTEVYFMMAATPNPDRVDTLSEDGMKELLLFLVQSFVPDNSTSLQIKHISNDLWEFVVLTVDFESSGFIVYYTMADNFVYQLILSSSNGTISAADELLMQTIVQSIKMD